MPFEAKHRTMVDKVFTTQVKAVGKETLWAPHLQRRLGEAQQDPLHLLRQQKPSRRQLPVERPYKLDCSSALSQPEGTAVSGNEEQARIIDLVPNLQ